LCDYAVTQGNGDMTHRKYTNLTNMSSAIISKRDFLIPAILIISLFTVHT